MITFKEVGFDPATLGGLAGYLKTEKGLFFVFSMKEDISKIEFNYSKTGDENDLVNAYEIDLTFEEGFYASLKPHVEESVLKLKLLEKSSKLYQEWKQKHGVK